MGKPMLIRKSSLTGRWYAFTSYKQTDKALIVTGKKWDVTEEIAKAVEQEVKP
jgi:hypothetical protein